MSIKLIEMIKNLGIKSKREKLELIKIFAIGIYTDNVVRKEEKDKALEIFYEAFQSEISKQDWSFFKNALDDKLQEYDNDLNRFLTEKEELENWILENNRGDLANILYQIYIADQDCDKREQSTIDKLQKFIKE